MFNNYTKKILSKKQEKLIKQQYKESFKRASKDTDQQKLAEMGMQDYIENLQQYL